MSKAARGPVISLKGVRHNNLKNFDLDLPLHRLIVITGVSGSGKSSLAFDTLFAEGQRRYIETFSPYARQFFDRMDKPRVDSIEGIPPAVAIEQRNSVKTTRSTVGTMTEICDHMKVLWPHLAKLHCRACGQPVQKDPAQAIWSGLMERGGAAGTEGEGGSEMGGAAAAPSERVITFDLPLSEKLGLEACLSLVAKQGYQRLAHDGEIVRLEEFSSLASPTLKSLIVVQDRVRPDKARRSRFVEACEQAYHFGKGKLTVWRLGDQGQLRDPACFSNRMHCARCDIEYSEPSPALFSFNHPLGACPQCRGFGRIISIDYQLAIPDRTRTLAQGVVKPWLTGMGMDCQRDLLRMCRHFEVPTNVPFEELPKKWQNFVIDGEPDYGKDEEHEWPRAWYGVKGYFRWLESKSYKMHVRVLLSRYRAYTPCPACKGNRLQPDSLLYKAAVAAGDGHGSSLMTLSDFYRLPIRDSLAVIAGLAARRDPKAKSDPVTLALQEVRTRLGYLEEVGLGYLTLDRPTRSLSGGETERVNLTTCLGTRLVNTLFVLDEPSVGLHSRDTERLVKVLQQLRDSGNTVVVVEHEASVMRAADQIIDLGPGHGATGGELVFQGSYENILRAKQSLTGNYLAGTKAIEAVQRRAVVRDGNHRQARWTTAGERLSREQDSVMLNDLSIPYRAPARHPEWLRIEGAARHNLKDLTLEIPLGRFVCVTGVSGSGKSTLVREVLMPGITERLRVKDQIRKASARMDEESGESSGENEPPEASQGGAIIRGCENLGDIVLVDQSILGKTPRSNPAVYIGAFDFIRDLFAQSELARQRGLNPAAFSFNSAQGQCERCRGAGFEKIEMQFLSDVFIRCPDCDGRRYREHILEIKIRPPATPEGLKKRNAAQPGGPGTADLPGKPRISPLSIADMLESTVDEAIVFLAAFGESRPAQKAAQALALLTEVGLGYLKLGQPINTLSGGESQRLKLVKHLAAATATDPAESPNGTTSAGPPTLFLFDEPTTGLHFDDVRVLLKVFHRLVDAGHSVLVIEHNLDVIRSADWLIDLGPEAGDLGGEIVAAGTPEEVAACAASHTGSALRGLLPPRDRRGRALARTRA